MSTENQQHPSTCGTCLRFRPLADGGKYGTCPEWKDQMINAQRAGCYTHMPRVSGQAPKLHGEQTELEGMQK